MYLIPPVAWRSEVYFIWILLQIGKKLLLNRIRPQLRSVLEVVRVKSVKPQEGSHNSQVCGDTRIPVAHLFLQLVFI